VPKRERDGGNAGALIRFFARYPGLRRQMGTSIVRYSTAVDRTDRLASAAPLL
jgi:hypothetical protein